MLQRISFFDGQGIIGFNTTYKTSVAADIIFLQCVLLHLNRTAITEYDIFCFSFIKVIITQSLKENILLELNGMGSDKFND